MDPITLTTVATQVMALLTPYLTKAGEEFASKFGDAAFEQCKRLYDAVRARFIKEAPKDGGNAAQALDALAKDPDMASAVQTKLVRILQEDPDFARELSQIIQSGPTQILTVRRDSSAKDTDIATTDSRSYQEILVEDNSEIEGTRMISGSGEVQKHRSRNRKKK